MSEGNYIQYRVPGHEYSVVHMALEPIPEDLTHAEYFEWVAERAYELLQALDARFPEVAANGGYVHPNGPSAPQNRTNGASAGNQWGFYCQQHNADLMPSVKNKTLEWDDAVQAEVPASWFHTLPDGKSCSVWRSKAGIRQAVGSR